MQTVVLVIACLGAIFLKNLVVRYWTARVHPKCDQLDAYDRLTLTNNMIFTIIEAPSLIRFIRYIHHFVNRVTNPRFVHRVQLGLAVGGMVDDEFVKLVGATLVEYYSQSLADSKYDNAVAIAIVLYQITKKYRYVRAQKPGTRCLCDCYDVLGLV